MKEKDEPLNKPFENLRDSQQENDTGILSPDNSISKPSEILNYAKRSIYGSEEIDYKKIGFLLAIREKNNHEKPLLEVKMTINEGTKSLIDSLEAKFLVKISQLQNRIEVFKEQLKEKDELKIDFKHELEEMRSEKKAIESCKLPHFSTV